MKKTKNKTKDSYVFFNFYEAVGFQKKKEKNKEKEKNWYKKNTVYY